VKQLRDGIIAYKQQLLDKGRYSKVAVVLALQDAIERVELTLKKQKEEEAKATGKLSESVRIGHDEGENTLEGKSFDATSKTGKEVWGKWEQPDATKFQVRGEGYLKKRVKVKSKDFLFPLQHVEFLKVEGKEPLDHVCKHPSSWWEANKPGKEDFGLVFNIQVTSIGISAVMYHILPGGFAALEKECPRVAKMLKDLTETDDKMKLDEAFKFIPRVVTGPFIVRCAVKETPVIMGKKVTQKYFSSDRYLEVDVHVDSSYAANAIIKLAHAYSVNIEVDMVWLLEAKKEEHLPERVLAGARLSNVNFSKVDRKVQVLKNVGE